MRTGASRRLRTWAAFGALTALLAGCYWTQPGFNSHRTGFNPHEHAITAANAAELEIEWSIEDVWSIEMVRSRSGLLHLFDSTDITTVDPTTGAIVWTASVAASVSGVPTIFAMGDVLYVPTELHSPSAGCIERFDVADGTPLGCLTYDLPDPAAFGADWFEAVASGPWIAATWSLTSTGGVRSGWLAMVHTTDPTRSWSVTIPAADGFEIGNPVIVDGQVLAVTSAAGEQSVLQRWPVACPGGGCGPVESLRLDSHLGHLIGANADGTQLAVVGDEFVEVIDLDTNEIAWSADVPAGTVHFPSSRPTWTPESLVVATYAAGGSNGGITRILRFDAGGCGSAICLPSWSAQLDGFSGGQVAAAEDILAVSTSAAPLVVLPEQCTDPCAPLFSLAGDAFWGGPVITDGRILATGDFDALETYPGSGDWHGLVAVRPPVG